MNETETQKLLEKFKNLPQHMKEAIVSADIDNAVLDIAKKHSLLLSEAGQLDNEIVLVLIGEKQASDFIKNIEKEVGLPKEKALAVGKDVNERIFEKIRSKMKANVTKPTPEPTKIDIKKIPEQPVESKPVQKPVVEAPQKQSLGISPTKPEPEQKPFLKENVEKPKENIMEQKLGGSVTSPAKEVEKVLPEEKSRPDAGSSKIDPYREPIGKDE